MLLILIQLAALILTAFGAHVSGSMSVTTILYILYATREKRRYVLWIWMALAALTLIIAVLKLLGILS